MLPPVVVAVHMPFDVRVTVVPVVTRLTFEPWTIVALLILVLLEILLIVVCIVAVLALPDMTNGIHVLPRSRPTAKLFVALSAPVHGESV